MRTTRSALGIAFDERHLRKKRAALEAIDVGLVVGFPEIARRRWRKRLANRALRRPFSVIAALLSLIFLAEGDRALPAEVTEAP